MRKKDLISGVISNELTKVFDTLNSLLSRDSSLLEEVVMLEARYNQTISDNHKGMVNRGEYNVEINQIKAGVLTLINSVGHLLDKDERELFC